MENSKTKLDRVFHPKSVAIVGASENIVKMGARCVQSLLQMLHQIFVPRMSPVSFVGIGSANCETSS